LLRDILRAYAAILRWLSAPFCRLFSPSPLPDMPPPPLMPDAALRYADERYDIFAVFALAAPADAALFSLPATQRESMLPRPLMRRCLRFAADAAADAVYSPPLTRRLLRCRFTIDADAAIIDAPPLPMLSADYYAIAACFRHYADTPFRRQPPFSAFAADATPPLIIFISDTPICRQIIAPD
jgi:hypothetical protein